MSSPNALIGNPDTLVGDSRLPSGKAAGFRENDKTICPSLYAQSQGQNDESLREANEIGSFTQELKV